MDDLRGAHRMPDWAFATQEQKKERCLGIGWQ